MVSSRMSVASVLAVVLALAPLHSANASNNQLEATREALVEQARLQDIQSAAIKAKRLTAPRLGDFTIGERAVLRKLAALPDTSTNAIGAANVSAGVSRDDLNALLEMSRELYSKNAAVGQTSTATETLSAKTGFTADSTPFAQAGVAKRIDTGGIALGHGAPEFQEDKFGRCAWVDATGATSNVFIPNEDATGWASYLAAAENNGVAIDACSCPSTSVTITASDGQTASATVASSYANGSGRPRASSDYYRGSAAQTFTVADDCATQTETVTAAYICTTSGWQLDRNVTTVSERDTSACSATAPELLDEPSTSLCTADPLICAAYMEGAKRLPDAAGAATYQKWVDELRANSVPDFTIAAWIAADIKAQVDAVDNMDKHGKRVADAFYEYNAAHLGIDSGTLCTGSVACTESESAPDMTLAARAHLRLTGFYDQGGIDFYEGNVDDGASTIGQAVNDMMDHTGASFAEGFQALTGHSDPAGIAFYKDLIDRGVITQEQALDDIAGHVQRGN